MENRMTWEEMAKKYPDQWVVVKDAVMDGPDIVSGFGKEPETGAVYKIPQFVLSDDSVVFIINNLIYCDNREAYGWL